MSELLPATRIKIPGWESHWPVEELRDWLGRMGRQSFQRGFQQKPQSDDQLLFPHFRENAIFDFGINWRALSDPESPLFNEKSPYYVDPAWPRYTGCDLSGRAKRGTCIFTLAIEPYGTRHILDIRLGNWGAGPDFVKQLELVYKSPILSPRVVFVENNAIQGATIEWAQDSGLGVASKIRPFYTGRNKMDPEIGLPSIDVQYEQARWRLAIPHGKYKPSQPDPRDPMICSCGLCMFWRDTSVFTRDDLKETPDTIMAQFFAKEASRQGERYSETSANVIKVSQKELGQNLAVGVGDKRQSLRLPVTLDGKPFFGRSQVSRFDFGRSENGVRSAHPDPSISHEPGICAACDRIRT